MTSPAAGPSDIPRPIALDHDTVASAGDVNGDGYEDIVVGASAGLGRIHLFIARDGGDIVIDVIDNGVGLPKENRSRLLEPYVTTREKGTGLGLAIVGKILEDHGGRIELRDAAEKTPGARGAWVRMRFAAAAVRATPADADSSASKTTTAASV